MTAGADITLSGAGFAPGETVKIQLHSTPVELGSATASTDGTVRATVTIPVETDGGQHEVVVTGQQSQLTASAALSVEGVATGEGPGLAVTGGSVDPIVLGGAIALLAVGALLLAVRTRLRRR
ncbi:hypothetical protein DC31_05540 [Microbacterium sp. CH12i]|uniref:hypothetical protein n=1 Tax=Microbacterium sp. CH12i TaxID=1479651 RepID=UPI000461285D|nr:hypothetical protein [Microbacterium sp. CH12i]KDA04778.1 hypothetical protein DC31_05540 [Microbacterium sp. CH12i]